MSERASLKYDSHTGQMFVRRTGDGRTMPKGMSVVKPVSLDFLRSMTDCDIQAAIDEARTFPGREIRMALVQRTTNHRGGLRYAS